MDEYQTIIHPIPPLFDENSKVLILGSFPSVLSRKYEFFYGHPQNRFWKVTSAVLGCDVPKTIDQKKCFLLDNGIAVWDVIHKCDIIGSSDSSIKNVTPNDLTPILNGGKIERIFCNGKTSGNLYTKYIYPTTKREAVVLPSTSPANAMFSLEKLIEEWRQILK